MKLSVLLPVPIYFIMLCKLVLTFEFVDENLWCVHSNETSSVVPSLGWDQGPTSLLVGKGEIHVIGCKKNQRGNGKGKRAAELWASL